MRLIDADKLKEKLLKMQDDIANKKVRRGSTKSVAWTAAYLLILDEYIKKLDEMPRVIPGCDADAILDAYGKGYSKGREDALSEASYDRGFLDSRSMKKEAEKADNKKSLIDEHEFESCFFGEKNK